MKNKFKLFLLLTLVTLTLISCIETSEIGDTDSIGKDQGQFWTSNKDLVTETGSVANTCNSTFGVNQATGHIKAYPSDMEGPMAKHVRAVSGNVYGTSYDYTNSGEDGLDNAVITGTSINTYLNNSDGTITDTSTGLMWMEVDADTTMDWENALSYCENLSYAGYDDWKLPDVKELQSLVDYSGNYPAIDSDFVCTEFSEDNPYYYYWTSSNAYFSQHDPTNYYAWYVAFGFAVGENGEDSHGAGAVRFLPKSESNGASSEGSEGQTEASVRAVRIDDNYYNDATSKVVTTGQFNSYDDDGNQITPNIGEAFYGQDSDYSTSPSFSFTDNGDGTITDNNTGLIWEKTPSDDHFSVEEAEAYCEELELGEKDDWRIPTAEELFSISDFSTGWPYLDQIYFDFPASTELPEGQSGGPQG